MNLSISPIRFNTNKTSFGMARFSQRGKTAAEQCNDNFNTMPQISTFNEYQDSRFLSKTHKPFKPPFVRFADAHLKRGDIDTVAQTILACGTTDSADANARFIHQLLASEDIILDTDGDDRELLLNAVKQVFDKNLTNANLSKEETIELLDFAMFDNPDDYQLFSWEGITHNSDKE